MLKKIAYPLVLLALFQIMGGHWVVFQLVAWSNMIVAYSQKSGFSKGIEETFDGEHPCCMCKKIEQGKKQEQNRFPDRELQKLAKKLDLLSPSKNFACASEEYYILNWERLDFSRPQFTQVPIIPPPRIA